MEENSCTMPRIIRLSVQTKFTTNIYPDHNSKKKKKIPYLVYLRSCEGLLCALAVRLSVKLVIYLMYNVLSSCVVYDDFYFFQQATCKALLFNFMANNRVRTSFFFLYCMTTTPYLFMMQAKSLKFNGYVSHIMLSMI